MKIVTYLMLLLLSSAIALSQTSTKAPFNSKLLEKKTVVKYVRMDGTEFTKFNDGNDWFLTKKSNGTTEMKFPGFVKTSQPIRIIYKSMNGNAFSTYDFKNWVKYNENDYSKPISTDNPNILEITKQPKEPVSDEFYIEFRLKTSASVNLTILDIQGRVITEAITQMNPGINHLSIPVEKLRTGSYTFKISAGMSFYSGVFIKL